MSVVFLPILFFGLLLDRKQTIFKGGLGRAWEYCKERLGGLAEGEFVTVSCLESGCS